MQWAPASHQQPRPRAGMRPDSRCSWQSTTTCPVTNSTAFPAHRHCRRVVLSARFPLGGLPRRVHGPFPSPISYRGGRAQRRHNLEQLGHRHNIGQQPQTLGTSGGRWYHRCGASDIPGLGKGRQKGQASPLVLDGDGVARHRNDQVPLSDCWGHHTKPTHHYCMPRRSRRIPEHR